jgi:hypothetical protein
MAVAFRESESLLIDRSASRAIHAARDLRRA